MLDSKNISITLTKLRAFLEKEGLKSLYIPSFDQNLSEYVPLEECPRYFATGFTGSVAEVLLTKDKNYLFVDGRYHEHAALECDKDLVDMVACPYGVSNFSSMLEKMQSEGGPIGIFSSRTPLKSTRIIQEKFEVKLFGEDIIKTLFKFKMPISEHKIHRIEQKYVGTSTSEKLARLINENEACFISSTDSLAWLSNCRGYDMPFMSSFRGKALGVKGKLHLFIPHIEKVCPSLSKEDDLVFYPLEQSKKILKSLLSESKTLIIDPLTINTEDFLFLDSIEGLKIVEKESYLIAEQAQKNENEQKCIEESFEKSNDVILKSLIWLKGKVASDEKVSERDFFNKTNEIYKEAGAIENSFNTIAGSGANSSIIHYKNPSPNKNITKGELVLLDSGAYYEGGYATDTTRTILAGGDASSEQKKMFTLVMKGWLALLNAEFPKGTKGKELDAIARKPIKDGGYDYAHGTGHGIGVHVHEGGYSITPSSEVEIKEGTHGSIEPGIYTPGVGGVRIENTVFVEAHPDKKETLRFRNLVWIGLDHNLIDQDLLNETEKKQLDDYEKECSKRSRSFG